MKQGLRAEVERVVGDLHIVVENHSDILRNNALPFRILIGLRTIGQFLFIEHSFLFKMTPYPIWMETSGIFKTRPKDRSPWISRGHREEWKRGAPAPVQCWKQTFLLLNRLQNSHNCWSEWSREDFKTRLTGEERLILWKYGALPKLSKFWAKISNVSTFSAQNKRFFPFFLNWKIKNPVVFLAQQQFPFSGLLLSVFRAPFAFLSLTPIQLFSIEIWRLATCAFVGKNLILFAWTVFSLHVGTNLVRQASSNETLLKIFAITQVPYSTFYFSNYRFFQLVSTCAASFFAFLTYFINRGSTIVYDNHVIDFVAINSAVLVLIKQVEAEELALSSHRMFQFLPDSILFATPFGRVKYTHLPFMGLITAGIIALVGLVEPVSILYFFFFPFRTNS